MKATNKVPTQTEASANLPAPRVPTEVESQNEREIRETGEAIIKKSGEVAGLYLSLCLNIRKNAIAPAVVSRILKELGFNRVRISEINRVANAPDDVFTNYQARAIGFNKAIEFARVTDAGIQETPAAKLLSEGGVSPMSRDEINEAISEDDGKPKDEAKKPTAAKRLDKLAKLFFKIAKKPGVWKSGDGWQLVLSKAKLPVTATAPAK